MVYRIGLALLILAAAAGLPPQAVAAENVCVLQGRGFFRIYVDAGGLLSAFGHDHVIEAGKIEGCAAIDLQNLRQSSVKLSFPTAELHVLDPKESAGDRAKVQKTMETDVLHITEYPQVTFESTGVTTGTGGEYRVAGELKILGKAQTAVIPVKVTRQGDGTYKVTGSYKFKQTAFGIEPIRLVAGTVRVKDEIRTEFELYLK